MLNAKCNIRYIEHSGLFYITVTSWISLVITIGYICVDTEMETSIEKSHYFDKSQ